jgi:hypothetical protein
MIDKFRKMMFIMFTDGIAVTKLHHNLVSHLKFDKSNLKTMEQFSEYTDCLQHL